jgi:hypothetical protein
VLSFDPLTPGQPQFHASIASNGVIYLMAWREGRVIRYVRFSAQGTPLDEEPRLLNFEATTGLIFPSVASNGKDFLIVWIEQHGETPSTVFAARIGRDGIPIDPAPLRLASSTAAAFNAAVPTGSPAVASDGDGYLVTWPAVYLGPFGQDSVQAIVVASDGSVGPEFTIAREDDPVMAIDVAFTGSSYLVLWSTPTELLESTSCIYALVPGYVYRSENLFAARVSSEGQVIETPRRLTLDSKDHRIPALVSAAGGNTVLWYGTACGQEEALRMTSFSDFPLAPTEGLVLERIAIGSRVWLDATAFRQWLVAAWSVDRTVKTIVLDPRAPDERVTVLLPVGTDSFKSVEGISATPTSVAIAIGGATPNAISVYVLSPGGRTRPLRR